MPKIKTHKATAKRFKKTKSGKFIQRKIGQDHFNARDSSKTTMGKRRDISVARENIKNIKRLMPYYKHKSYAR